jgi:hypothetical protein
MKKILIGGLILVLLCIGGFYFYSRNQQQNTVIEHPLVSIAPTSSIAYCSQKDLQTTVVTDPGAGNINGMFEIKNISGANCQIVGNNTIMASYNEHVIKNIAVTHTGKPEMESFELAPNQSVYARLHYPNGPQCSGPTQTANVAFSYAISPTDTISFKEESVRVCSSDSEMTTITLWNISSQPVN